MSNRDVIAVLVKAPHTVRLMTENQTQANADAVIKTAVWRRGVDKEFFVDVPTGMYKEGATYHGGEATP